MRDSSDVWRVEEEERVDGKKNEGSLDEAEVNETIWNGMGDSVPQGGPQ